jgi:hypothetical protein
MATSDSVTHHSYVDRDTAFGSGLAFWTKTGLPGIQAEHWNPTSVGENRNSVRLESRTHFGGGLFIVDLALMPWGCGVWPAGEFGFRPGS